MDKCAYQEICGGCPLRNLDQDAYYKYKSDGFNNILRAIHQENITIDTPVFIEDGNRRRAELDFICNRGKLEFGFNARKSHVIADIDKCLSLAENINSILPNTKLFLQELCAVQTMQKDKRKFTAHRIDRGSLWIVEAANGLDMLLEVEDNITLQHRLIISEFVNNQEQVIRFSVKIKNTFAETIVEKTKPIINIGGYNVFIPAGTFLQASVAGEKALINLVMKYVGDFSGTIADLFCGVGTFSYPLSQNIKNKITSIDLADELLDSFQKTVYGLTIPNIKIVKRNLFKDPLDAAELKKFDLVIFDPPRAGAHTQVKQFSEMNSADKPQKIIAISCNPHTFVNDANVLIECGYKLTNISMVDQFVCANHFELVARFEKNKGEDNEPE